MIDLENAVKSMAVLSFIPSAVFALWGDYFGKHIDQQWIKRSKTFDPQPEIEKIKIFSGCILLFQFCLFLGSHEIRKAFPNLAQLVVVSAVGTQLFLQTQLEKRIDPKGSASGRLLRLAIRATLSWMFATGIYLSLLFASIQVSTLIGIWLHTSPLVSATLLLLGGIMGISMGLLANFALAPIHVRLVLPVTDVPDSKFIHKVHTFFSESSLRRPTIKLIDLDSVPLIHVLLVGLQRGPRLFWPHLFISQKTYQNSSPKEIEVMVKLQISQTLLGQFKKKFILSFLLILATTVLSIFSIVTSQFFTTLQTSLELVGPGVAICGFILSFRMIHFQSKKHQYEADQYVINHFKVLPELLIDTLRRLDHETSKNEPTHQMGFPETEKRIQRIKMMNHQTNHTTPNSFSKSLKEELKKAG